MNDATPKRNALLFTALALIFLALAILGLFRYNDHRTDELAQQKAAQLVTQLQAAGLPGPKDIDTITGTFGADGGAMCEDPSSALKKALYQVNISNGAATVGIRPIRADIRVVKGEQIALGVYCPEELEEFNEFVKDNKYDDVIND